MAEEMHISSMVVLVRPEAADAVVAGIGALPGAEVQARARERLVVTLESQNESAILETVDRISALPGVFSTALVFHHCELRSEE